MLSKSLCSLAALIAVGGAFGGAARGAEVEFEGFKIDPATVAGEFPRKIVFVERFPAKGSEESVGFLRFDAQAFNAISFIKAADPLAVDWDLKLNPGLENSMSATELATFLGGADTLVQASGAEWQLIRIKSGNRVVMGKAPPPKSNQPAELASWLLSALGWDGVVLDVKADRLLVGSVATLLTQPDIQALMVADSAASFSLAKEERQGAALLTLSATKAGLAVFEVLLHGKGDAAVVPGTKLIIERRKR